MSWCGSLELLVVRQELRIHTEHKAEGEAGAREHVCREEAWCGSADYGAAILRG
jgi:hypothetical protein